MTVAACDTGGASSGVPVSSGETSVSAPSVSTSEFDYDTNVIQTKNYIGLTVTADKKSAKAGETVTLTVAVEEGYTLLKLMMNGSEDALTKVSETTYTFLMPDRSAVITAQMGVSGDITIQGGVATALSADPETGIYVARNVTVEERAGLYYMVNGTRLSVSEIDDTRCFADIDLSGSGDAAFYLAGNAKYDFYFDPSNGDRPCYIIRTAVLNAPSSVADFQSLFSGSVRSEPTTWPQNVKKVTYTNSQTGDSYVWEDYVEGSLGISNAKNGSATRTSYSYKSIGTDSASGKNVYTVVDTYIEGSKGNADPTRQDDNTAFSGVYEIVDSVTPGYTKYQYLSEAAEFDAHHYSHDVESLDFDIHYGYRTGFDMEWNEYLKDFNIDISSQRNADGSFTTHVASYKTIDSTLATDSSVTKEKVHTEYRIDFTFTEAGAPLSGSYSETTYNESAYDFGSFTFLTGGESMGTSVKEMSFSYEYGDPKAGSPEFDTTPYFISRLDNLKIHNDITTVTETCGLEQFDMISDYFSFDAYPETALDGWQYGVTRSDNLNVVAPRYASEPLNWKAFKTGTVHLSVGNHTTNAISEDVTVEVVNDHLIDGFYMSAAQGYYDEEVLSNVAYVRSGCIKRAKISGVSRNLGKYYGEAPCDFTATSSAPELLSVYCDNVNRIITYDASAANVTTATNVSVTIHTPSMNPAMSETVFTVTILPYSAPSEPLYGTWNDQGSEDYPTVEAVLKEYVEGDASTKSTLTVDGKEYTFLFHYDAESGRMEATASGELGYISIIYDDAENQIGIFAAISSWGGLDDISTTVLLGSGADDGESGFDIETYYFLDKVSS